MTPELNGREVFYRWGYPNSWFIVGHPMKIDENWGYPHLVDTAVVRLILWFFRNPAPVDTVGGIHRVSTIQGGARFLPSTIHN